MQKPTRETEFRADIEGLRAVAVLAVVFYHAQAAGFVGGFIGVDVFFVISGYLITQLLMRELKETGRINVLSFWARRARRLLPNALLTLLVTIILVALAQAPTLLEATKYDVVAALVYLANYHFAARAVDYFDAGALASPVLHFWTLSVEEQFYIGLPLLLSLIVYFWRAPSRRTVSFILIIIAISSFAASLLWMTKSQPAAFFHTESRIWQIALGGILAMNLWAVHRLPGGVLSALSWIGLLTILTCALTIDDSFPYPGLWALLPAFSSVAIIAGGLGGQLGPNNILALSPLRWIGRLSYSIYLWHWPLLVLAPLMFPEFAFAKYAALLAILPVSAAAYYLVENPIRQNQPLKKTPGRVLASAGTASLSVAIAALLLPNVLLTTDPEKQARHKLALKAKSDRARELIPNCALRIGDYKIKTCRFGDENADRVAVLIGDSHAEHLFAGLNAASKKENWALHTWTKASCPPVDVKYVHADSKTLDETCVKWREAVIARILSDKPSVVFIASWSGIAKWVIDPETGKRLDIKTAQVRWKEGFEKVVRRLTDAGLKVVVIRGTPRTRRPNVLDCVAAMGPGYCGTPKNEALNAYAPELEVARKIPNVDMLDLTDSFCGRNVCYAMIDGKIVYRDKTHITATFSKSLAPQFAQVLRRNGN